LVKYQLIKYILKKTYTLIILYADILFLLLKAHIFVIGDGVIEMKIKTDFVTNSSSTSFILPCRARMDSKDDFINKFNSLLKDYIKDRSWDDDFQEPPLLTSDMVTQDESDLFIIKDYASIYHSEKDIPQYIRELIDDNSDIWKLLNENGINPLSVDIKDLNETT